jgi:hypothetical protein
MKFSVWDALSILALIGLCVVGIVVATIFTNPASAFNPFPPPTLPASIVLPSETPTPFYMPPTWTPVGGGGPKVVETIATQTPPPTATGFVLPSFTPIPPTVTDTPTPTETSTPTETRTPTNTKVPHTNTPKPTIALVCLNIDQSVKSVTPPTASAAGGYNVDITVHGDSDHKVNGVSVSFSTSKKTTAKWTCSASDGSCHSSGSGFTSSSINMFANGSVTIHVTGVIPKGTKATVSFKSTVHAPDGTSNQCNPNVSSTFASW